jgi:transporter family-2 protein
MTSQSPPTAETEVRTATPAEHAGSKRLLGTAGALLCGAAVAVQSRINGDLGTRLHDGIAAALVSFGIGLVLLAVLAAALPSVRRGLARVRDALEKGRLGWWHLLGGTGGALLVMSQGVTVPALGVAVFTVATVAGQSTSSLAVDRIGLGPTGRHPLTTARVVGTLLTVVAILVAVSRQFSQPAMLFLAVLPALAGVAVAWQQAVNGLVRQQAGAALSAAFVNFVAGIAALIVIFAVDVAVRGWPTGSLPHEPWLYLGGPVGVLFIAVSSSVVRWTGVLLLSLGAIAGQLTAAAAIDFAAPGPAGPPNATTLLGLVLTLVAVGIAALPSRHCS